MPDESPYVPPAAADRHFATTQWSVVLAAGQRGSEQSRAALARLCESYWYPLYAYLRRQGCTTHDAQDLTQAFFAQVLDKNYLAAVDRGLGKFRSFLLTSLRHFVANERDRARAKKRGGGQGVLSLDFDKAEGRYAAEPANELTPERLFEQQWAMEVLAAVLQQLHDELTANGKDSWFKVLKPLLAAEADAPPYAEVAQRLETTAGAVKTTVHRLRRRYKQLLHDEVAKTVADPAEIDDELRQLVAAIRGK
jgi:RNA polymerase sigma-70 factor (ECF subfamily)